MKQVMATLLLTVFLSPLFADVQTENSELARINSVLNAIYPLIDAAQKFAPKHTRITFHYDWLKQDIQSIQAGIAQKINQVSIEPRMVPVLKVHYVKLNDKERHHE